MSEILLQSRVDDIVTLTINRPEKLNAMTKPLWGELGDAIVSLSAQEDVRCIILRGAGEKAF